MRLLSIITKSKLYLKLSLKSQYGGFEFGDNEEEE